MERKSDKKSASKGTESREDRLKAALKVNMARRKAQAKARAGSDKSKTGEKGR